MKVQKKVTCTNDEHFICNLKEHTSKISTAAKKVAKTILHIEWEKFIMEFNKELLEKAKEAKNVEELKALAKENEIELTDEQAEAYFEKLNPKSGELADEELDNVSGGCDEEVHSWYSCSNWVCRVCGAGYSSCVYTDTGYRKCDHNGSGSYVSGPFDKYYCSR